MPSTKYTNEKTPHFEIRVKKHHITDAIQSIGSLCMIRSAIKEHIPSASKIMVDIQSIRFSFVDRQQNVRRVVYATPRPAQLAIAKFDSGVSQPVFKVSLRDGRTIKVESRAARAARKQRSGPTTVAPRSEGAPPRATVGMRRQFGLCYLPSLFQTSKLT